MPGRRVAAIGLHRHNKKHDNVDAAVRIGGGNLVDKTVDSIQRRRPHLVEKTMDALETWTPGENIMKRR